jgi:hypothetical protein
LIIAFLHWGEFGKFRRPKFAIETIDPLIVADPREPNIFCVAKPGSADLFKNAEKKSRPDAWLTA